MLYLLLFLSFTHVFVRANEERRLYEDLMVDYDIKIRPVKAIEEQLLLTIHPTLQHLMEVNEVKALITMNMWVSMIWNDYNLTWNPVDYSNITNIRIPKDSIWQPDIVLYGSHELARKDDMSNYVVFVNYNGTVLVEERRMFNLICEFHMEEFPYDLQKCVLEFGSWMYPIQMIDVVPLRNFGGLQLVEENAEWHIVSFESDTEARQSPFATPLYDEQFSSCSYFLVVRRRPHFFLLNLALPSFLLTTLSIVGLFSPTHNTGLRQQKVSIGLTTMLGMVVLLNIVADLVPRASQGLPLLGRYVVVELGMISMATFLSVVFMHADSWISHWSSYWRKNCAR